jgi:predicted phosphodiesterase
VLIAAVSDIHAPKNTRSLLAGLQPKKVDLVMFAGDMVESGCPEALREVIDGFTSLYGSPIVACFGNGERPAERPKLKRLYSDITWLEDSGAVLDVHGTKVNVFGSQGVLRRPTHWQSKNLRNVHLLYKQRKERIVEYFSLSAKSDGLRILLTHYASATETLLGEGPNYWPELGDDFSPLFNSGAVDLSIHGHAHLSQVTHVEVGHTKVFNVAFPAAKGVTYIEL